MIIAIVDILNHTQHFKLQKKSIIEFLYDICLFGYSIKM